MLQLATEGRLGKLVVDEAARNGDVIDSYTAVGVLVDKRAEEDGARRERVARAEPEGMPLFLVSQSAEEVLREETLLNVALLQIPVAVLGLEAGVRRNFLLNKDVTDFIPLVGVFSKPVGGKVESTDAEGCLLVDPRRQRLPHYRCYSPRPGRSSVM